MDVRLQSFPALRIRRFDDGVRGALETMTAQELGPGEVLVRVQYSSINYKDALAVTGAGDIARRLPLIAGVDLAGEVLESADPTIEPGRHVLACGGGLGETHDGGYAVLARVPADLAVPIPEGLDPRSAMAIGTAGLTAALALERLEVNGQSPEHGPIVITGATGGVGSLAIDMFAKRGYEVVAVTGKLDRADYLRKLGAASVLDRRAIEPSDRPLERARWGGAVDTLGGEPLAWLMRTTRPEGSIACVGLAASRELHATVLPLILRGVSLLGINSVLVPKPHRIALWNRLATDLRPPHLDDIVTAEVSLHDLSEHCRAFIDGQAVGRTVVAIPG